MSLADPATVTISGTPISLPRVSTGENKSEYLSGDGFNRLTVSHDYGKRYRRMLRFDTSKIAPDVFDTSENVRKSMSSYIVFDVPDVGYTAAEQLAVWVGFNTWLTATSNAVVSKALGGES